MGLISIVKRLFGYENPEYTAMEYAYSKGLKTGNNFSYNNGFPIDCKWAWLIEIGDNVTLATGVTLLAYDSSTAKIPGVRTKTGRVTIGNNVFIGANSIVLPNTKIDSDVIIGSGSVVTKNIPDNCVYAGNPAKFICTYEDFCKKHLENQKICPVFAEHPWHEWSNASEKERENMKEKLKDTYGYL